MSSTVFSNSIGWFGMEQSGDRFIVTVEVADELATFFFFLSNETGKLATSLEDLTVAVEELRHWTSR